MNKIIIFVDIRNLNYYSVLMPYSITLYYYYQYLNPHTYYSVSPHSLSPDKTPEWAASHVKSVSSNLYKVVSITLLISIVLVVTIIYAYFHSCSTYAHNNHTLNNPSISQAIHNI